MATSDGDGRLELDELGAVLDDATSLPQAETLEDPHGSPSLRERLEDAGVLPWMRRHRVITGAVAGAAALVVVVLGVRAWTAPPPLELDITATVVDATGALRGGGAAGEVLTGTYTLTDARPGETVEIIAVSGPGLRTGTAVPAAPFGGPDPDFDVSAVIDCDDPLVLEARDDQYSLWVSRTDRWDRTVVEPRPVPSSVGGWAQTVRVVCWPDAVTQRLSVDDVAVRTDPARGSVTLLLTISSRLPIDVRIGSLDVRDDTVQVGRTFSPLLEAGGSAELDVLLDVRSCVDVAVPAYAWSGAPGYMAPSPGLLFAVSSTDSEDGSSLGLPFSDEQVARVQGGLDDLCAGAPEVRPRLVSAGPAAQARDLAVLLPVSVRLDVTDGRLVSASIPRDDLTSEPAVLLPDADGVVTGSWLVYCGFPKPMRVEAVVEAGGRTYPWAWSSDDEELATRIVASCPALTREALTTYGWPPVG